MWELQSLMGSTGRRIALQTRLGRDIDNAIIDTISEKAIRDYELLLKRHGANWKRRSPPTAAYNCAGHVWATRRTGIYEPSDWEAILDDDGYRITKNPQPDDLIIYADKKDGILHIGRVIAMVPGVTPESPAIAKVVSKWGCGTGEVVHLQHDTPYPRLGFDVRWDYWTDRPDG